MESSESDGSAWCPWFTGVVPVVGAAPQAGLVPTSGLVTSMPSIHSSGHVPSVEAADRARKRPAHQVADLLFGSFLSGGLARACLLRRCLWMEALGKHLLACRAVPLLVLLVGDLALDKQLCELSALRLALEGHLLKRLANAKYGLSLARQPTREPGP